MDKRVIFAVAGSGKTTYIVNELSLEKRSLILTYTDGNYDNLSRKILEKFNGVWPNTVTLMTYFSFLYNFCYKPYLADKTHARGITFKSNPNRYDRCTEQKYFLSSSLSKNSFNNLSIISYLLFNISLLIIGFSIHCFNFLPRTDLRSILTSSSLTRYKILADGTSTFLRLLWKPISTCCL